MRLIAARSQTLNPCDPSDLVVDWKADVLGPANFETWKEGQPSEFPVGRFVADVLHPFEISKVGVNVWEVADADSEGLQTAWASLLDEKGRFRRDEFEAIGDPIVYLYRFALHPDFVEWRLSAVDAFCRMFGHNTIILAQYHTTWLSETEFGELGFHLLEPTRYRAPSGLPHIDGGTRFMVRDGAMESAFTVAHYPDESPVAESRHQEWLESQGPWEGFC